LVPRDEAVVAAPVDPSSARPCEAEPVSLVREQRRDRSAARPKPRGMMANSMSMLVGRIVVAILGWSGTILIVRSLSHTEWGEYSFVFSLLGLVAIISNVVNSQVALHGLLQDDADRFAGSYVLLRGLMGLLAYSLALAFIVLAGYPTVVVEATAVGGLIVIIATPGNGYDAIFNIHMRMDRVAVAAMLGQLAQFALTAIIAVLGGSVVVFTIPAVLCEIVIIVWKLSGVGRLQHVRYVPDMYRWARLLRAAAPLAIGFGAATAYYSLDSIMLSKLDTFRAVGTYGIAYKFAGLIGFIPSVLCAVLLAVLVRSWTDDRDRFYDALRRTTAMLVSVALLVTLEFVLFAGQVIRLLYGSQYVSAAGATRLVVGGECLGFFTTLAVTVFAALQRNRFYPVAAIAGLVVNFAANLYFIPRYSFHGAAWVTLGTELLVVTILWVPLLRRLERSPMSIVAVPKIAVVGAGAAGVGLLAPDVIGWPAASVLVAIVFVFGLYLTRFPDKGGLVALFREEVPAVEPGLISWQSSAPGLAGGQPSDDPRPEPPPRR
jgi:O-antigen/teichoic acid export membrane protein